MNFFNNQSPLKKVRFIEKISKLLYPGAYLLPHPVNLTYSSTFISGNQAQCNNHEKVPAGQNQSIQLGIQIPGISFQIVFKDQTLLILFLTGLNHACREAPKLFRQTPSKLLWRSR